MSNKYVNSAKSIKVGNPTGKAVLLLLADKADETGYCWPSEEYVALVLETGVSTARKWLGYLAERNIVIKDVLDLERVPKHLRGQFRGPWKRNGYQLNFDPAQNELFKLSVRDGKSTPSRGGDKERLPLYSGGETDGKSDISPPQASDEENYHRYEVESSPLRGITDTSERLIISSEKDLKPSEESPDDKERESGETPHAPPQTTKAITKDHSAVQAYHKATGFYPHAATYEEVARRLGDDPDQVRLKAAWTAWLMAGNKPTNVAGVLDWYEFGVPVKQQTGRAIAAGLTAGMPYNVSDPYSIEDPFPDIDVSPSRPPAEVSKEEAAAWAKLLEYFAARLNKDVFNTWFGPVIFDGIETSSTMQEQPAGEAEGRIKLRCGRVTKDWIELYYSELVEAAITAVLGEGDIRVEWEIEDEYVPNTSKNIEAVNSS